MPEKEPFEWGDLSETEDFLLDDTHSIWEVTEQKPQPKTVVNNFRQTLAKNRGMLIVLIFVLRDVFTPIDHWYQRIGDILVHLGTLIVLIPFNDFWGCNPFFMMVGLMLRAISCLIIVGFQFFNLQQSLIRSALKKAFGDATQPDLLWRKNLLSSPRDRRFY